MSDAWSAATVIDPVIGLPGDPCIPGFTAALDPASFSRELGEQLARFDLKILSCALDRFRYRERERLIVVYKLVALDRATLSTRAIIVTGRTHAQGVRKVPRPPPLGDLPPVLHLPGLQMRVEIFPEDRRMPALRRLVEEPHAGTMAALLQTALGHAAMHSTEIGVRPVRYRPGIAATIRYDLRTMRSECASKSCFVKIQANGGAADTISRATRINLALARAQARLTLSTPAARSADGIDVFTPAGGDSLYDLIRCSQPLAGAAGASAGALATLHRLDVSALPEANGQRVQRKLERAHRFLAWACPHARYALDHIARHAAAIATSGVRGATHGDMKPDHLFLSEDARHAELIDNESIALANPLLDLGSMLARLDAMVWLDGAPRDRIGQFTSALAETYFDLVPRSWRPHLAPARALGTLFVCQHAVQRLAPGWHTHVASELERVAATM